VEAEASQPAEQITIGNSVIYVTKDAGGNIIKASGIIFLNEIEELAQKSTNNIVIDTNGLTIKSFDGTKIIEVAENDLQAVINKLSVLNIENQDFTKQSITLNIENNKLKITSVTGNISLKDVTENSNEEKTEIVKYIAKNLKENSDTNFDSSNLTINTFYKTKKRGTPSRDSSQRNPEYTYESTPITPKFLKETKQNALNKAVLNFKDGDVNVPVAFKSTLTDYFDVNEFYKEVKTGKLNILKDTNITIKNDKPNSIQILLRDLQETITSGKFNITPYIKADQILELINNEKLKDALVIGDMYVTGNVKDLLPLLTGQNAIKEINGGVKFLNVKHFTCPGPNVTEYDGGKDNTEPLPMEQLLEFRKRTDILEDEVLEKDTRSTRIQNLVLNNIDTTSMSQENLELLNFERNSVTGNITFKNSNLSKMQYRGTSGPVNVTFDNTILPMDMLKSGVNTLILKNAKLPEELKETDPEDLPYRLPNINNNLKIFNLELLNKWTEADLSTLDKVRHPPKKYVGPKNVWDKFKHLYLDEGTKTHFTNEDLTDTPLENINFSSIQKQQNQLLALLQNQGKSRG